MACTSILYRLASLGLASAALVFGTPASADAFVSTFGVFSGQFASAPVSLSRTNSQNTPSFVSQSFASADLNTATLRASITGESLSACCFTGNIVSATARISDDVTFLGAGSSVLVNLSLLVDGTFAMTGVATSATVDAVLGLGVDSASLHLVRNLNPGNFGDFLNGSVTGSPGSFLNKTLNSANAGLVLSVIVPTNVAISFTALLSLQGQGAQFDTLSANFANTAQVALSLPVGYSFASASGHFLSAPVPEPETYAMILAGLGLLGFVARRRKQQAA